MGFASKLGEIEEMGAGGELVPESHYPLSLSLGEASSEGGTPYRELIGTILEGPFKGTELARRLYLTPGGPDKAGRYVGFFRAACKRITGKEIDEAAALQFGFEPPPDEASGDEHVGAFHQFYHTLQGHEQLDLMEKVFRVREWEGKRVVAFIRLEERTDEKGVLRQNNSWGGFHAFSDPKKGIDYCRKVAFLKQKDALNESVGASAGASA